MSQPSGSYGVLPGGFAAKGEAEFASEETADLRATIANDLDVSPASPLGAIISEDASQNAQLEQLCQAGYNATNRGAANGALLDNIGALFGCPRQPATFSTVYCSCAFTAAGTYAAGALQGFVSGLSSQNATNVFPVVVPAINPGNGIAVSTSNPYVTGSSYAAATQFSAPFTGPNFATALIAANAVNPGDVGAFTGQVPVNGWASVVDLSTPNVGTDIEEDTPYQARQAQELGAQGSCNLAAIAVDVIEALQGAAQPTIAGVQIAENTGDYTDSTGLLPHSYAVFVFDGLNPNTQQNDPLIGQAIWNNKPASLKPYGTTSVTVHDVQGVQRTVSFTRPTPRPFFMIVNVTIAENANAVTVAELIEVAIQLAAQGRPFTAYGALVSPAQNAPTTLLPGVDLVPQAFAGIAQAQTGVVQVTSVLAGFAPNPTQELVVQIPRGNVAVIASGSQGTGLVVNASTFTP